MTASPPLPLGADFPPADPGAWRGMVAKIVGRSAPEGAPVTDPIGALTSTSRDGLSIAPLYLRATDGPATGEPGAAPFTRGRTAAGLSTGWDVRAHYAEDSADALNAQILDDLGGGATSLWLQVGAGGIGIDDLPAALDGVLLDLAGICLDAGGEGPNAAEEFLNHAHKLEVPAGDLTGCLGLDPFGWLARTGGGAGWDGALTQMGALAVQVAAAHPGLRTVVADGLPYHDAGSSDAEELGLALAAGVASLRVLTEAGLSAAAAFGQIEFRLSVTADQFGSIAKLRAARRLWSRIASECRVTGPQAGMRQHAVTSWPMTTRQDPWNNMLRTTLAAFAACIGGADSVTIAPFDAALGRPDEMARRIARNTAAVLIEESHLGKVIDPGGGSWYLESFTEDLAHAAWAAFTEIEAAGGLVAVLRDGRVAERLAASREARVADLLSGKDSIVGVSVFPPAGQVLPVRAPALDPPGGGLPRVRWEELFNAAKAAAA